MRKFRVTTDFRKKVTKMSLKKTYSGFGSVRPWCSRTSRHGANTVVAVEHFKSPVVKAMSEQIDLGVDW